MAQAMRAVLLARASSTTLVGWRASRAVSQAERISFLRRDQLRWARAPCTNRRLIYPSPRFEMRPSRSLPPLECCCGTRPSQARELACRAELGGVADARHDG